MPLVITLPARPCVLVRAGRARAKRRHGSALPMHIRASNRRVTRVDDDAGNKKVGSVAPESDVKICL
jgi:hypothetical protein